MKSLFPALLLSAAVPALCQTAPQPAGPKPPPIMPHEFTWSPRTSPQPPVFRFDRKLNSVPLPQVVLPAQTPRFGDPRLDAQIIHRPPLSDFAQQPPRSPLSRNLYPDLKLLPIETAQLENIPIYWPKAKIEQIPITWPDAKLTPAQSYALKPVAKP